MPALENPKHEAFCQARHKGMTKDQAYKDAGYKPSRTAAHRLSTNVNIVARLKELQQKTAVNHEVTVDTIAAELDLAIQFARKYKHTAAMVAAINSKAKLFGLMTDRSVINVTSKYALMTEEELRFEIAAIHAEARALKPGVPH